LPRGVSRTLLQEVAQRFFGGHGLAPWSLTYVATRNHAKIFWRPRACPVESHVRCYKKSRKDFLEATGLPRGVSRTLLQEVTQRFFGGNGLAPWSLTYVATRNHAKIFWRPRACPVEFHVSVLRREQPQSSSNCASANVNHHRARRWPQSTKGRGADKS